MCGAVEAALPSREELPDGAGPRKQANKTAQAANKQTNKPQRSGAGLSVTSAYSGRPQVLEYCGGGTLEAFAVDSAEQRELARGYAPPPPARSPQPARPTDLPTATSQPTRAQSATRAKAHMKRARTRQPCVRARGTHA